MKRALLLTGIVILLLFFGELSIRVVERGDLPLWKLTTLLLAVCVLLGGILFFMSYFMEKRWRVFSALIWVCENILPIGGRSNALILGIAGILSGILALLKLLEG